MYRKLDEKNIKQMRLHDYINYDLILKDGKTIRNKDESLTQVLKVTGRSFNGLTEDDAVELWNARLKAYKSPTEGVFMQVFIDRREAEKVLYKQNFPSVHIKNLYEKQNNKDDIDFTTDIYIAITTYINQNIVTDDDLFIWGPKNLESLNNVVNDVCLYLNKYNPVILNAESGLKTYLSKRLNYTKCFSEPKANRSLGSIMSLTDIKLDEITGKITFENDDKENYGFMLRLNALPDVTYQNVLDIVTALKYNFTISQNITYLSDEKMENKLAKNKKTMTDVISAPLLKPFQLEAIYSGDIQQYEQAAVTLANKETKLVKYVFQVLVYAETEEKLENAYKEIKNALRMSSIEVRKEKSNLHNAFFSQMPGFQDLNFPREEIVYIQDVTNFASLSAYSEGFKRCTWGDRPVCQLSTLSNTKFNFTFHENEEDNAAGNTVIVGPTGSGKTTVAAFLLAMCLTYGQTKKIGGKFKGLIFDAGRGLAPQVKAMGGTYIDLADPTKLPMNPFLIAKDEKDTANIKFLIDWVSVLAGGSENLNERELLAIDKAVRAVLQLEPKYRKIMAMLPTLRQNAPAKEGDISLVEKLKKWTVNPENPENSPLHAQYFNSDKDALNFEKQIVAFDMESLLKGNDDLLIPIMMYITHAYHLNSKREPAPHMVYIDEANTYLRTSIGASFINDLMMKIRKNNGIVMPVTQTVGHILKCSQGESISQNIVTKIFLPNPDADVQELRDFNLNDSDIDWITKSSESRKILIKKKGMQSVIVDVDFSKLGKYLHFITGSQKDIMYINRYLEEYDYEDAVFKYLDKKEYLMKTRG